MALRTFKSAVGAVRAYFGDKHPENLAGYRLASDATPIKCFQEEWKRLDIADREELGKLVCEDMDWDIVPDKAQAD